ncbi:hypothetical protein CTR2_R09560 [Comamonas thiooxydans]|uniref:hypothetical protein n=1 Tax=Comamonas thiooxydans TaxID=363952 RepID=UPI00111FF93F|nr:hypothetical protein [Comamonas thiooxydans]BDR07618.1 hypothetical protein CTR2_R09560 [Comamonas thiooxydans]
MVALIAVIGSALWFEVIYAGFEIFFSQEKSRANARYASLFVQRPSLLSQQAGDNRDGLATGL